MGNQEEQGGANRFDSFFFHEKWTNLRANTSVGNRASELMEELTKIQQSVVVVPQPAPAPDVEVVGDDDEEMESAFVEEIGDLVSAGIAEAYAAAKKNGTEVTSETIADVKTKVSASAKASGKLKVLRRSKKAVGKITLAGSSGTPGQ